MNNKIVAITDSENTVYEYDIATDQWKAMTGIISPAVEYDTSFVFMGERINSLCGAP